MYSGSSEIVEEKDEIKKMFQAISNRSASRINGDSKPTSIKKAFRDFSLSKASEMATVKGVSYQCTSPQRIQTLYDMLAFDVPVSQPNIPAKNKGKETMMPNIPVKSGKPDVPVERKGEDIRKAKVLNEKKVGRARKPSTPVAKKGEETRTRYIAKAEVNLQKRVQNGAVWRANSGALKRSVSKKKKQTVCEKCKCEVEKREREEISLTSKSSGGECSTSTSNSEGTVTTRPSCGIKPHKSKDFKWEEIRRTKHRDGYVSLNHFNLVRKLGGGDIGTVYLAELIGSSSLFAIKVMDLEFLSRRKKMQRAHTEREILKILDHPFLPTLYTQFTFDNLSCLVMEYCPGGDLHVLRQMQPGRCFSETATRFYVAEVLLALEYLHMLGIIYRDLKPENVLVGEDGHIMLTDFDLSLTCEVYPTLRQSSTVTDQSRMCIQPCFKSKGGKTEIDSRRNRLLPEVIVEPNARSSSFVGTHEYLAPEIIKGEGHGAAVDWWTLGVFAYEMMYGRTPFKGSGNEETLGNVVAEGLRFPEEPLMSAEARDLIRRLLVKEPERRLGWERGAAEIKSHPFFGGLNWALVRCMQPPETSVFESPALPLMECKTDAEHLEFEFF